VRIQKIWTAGGGKARKHCLLTCFGYKMDWMCGRPVFFCVCY
jgi:hypothetical protein